MNRARSVEMPPIYVISNKSRELDLFSTVHLDHLMFASSKLIIRPNLCWFLKKKIAINCSEILCYKCTRPIGLRIPVLTNRATLTRFQNFSSTIVAPSR